MTNTFYPEDGSRGGASAWMPATPGAAVPPAQEPVQRPAAPASPVAPAGAYAADWRSAEAARPQQAGTPVTPVAPAARMGEQRPVQPAARPAAGQPVAASGERRAAPTAPGRGRVATGESGLTFDLDALLRYAGATGASDLHMTIGAKPMVRRSGSLVPVDGAGVLDKETLKQTLYQILTQRQREQFEAELELDFSYQVHNGPRFRVNFYQQREAIGAAFRVIPAEIKQLEELGVPAVVSTFAGLPRGLVLVTGPTGSGKSTTLAGIIDLANRTRADHIMSVEDPIEFLHQHKKSIINQREVGSDTHSFGAALKHVLRQDPDIILVGELRDLETISTALTAAETGHLVFATLHTQDAAQTIDRIIDVFPSHQQAQVRTQLGGALQAVVCQTLCKRSDGPGRVVATEVMVATSAVRNLIREGKTHQIYSLMQAGKENGMHSMDQHLAELARQGRISYETGLEKCHHIEEFNRLMGRSGSAPGAGFAQLGNAGGFGYMEG